jgi:tRNA-uridine 2-sulfurtransferase
VGGREELQAGGLEAGDLNWVAQAGPPAEPLRCAVQIRQRHRAAAATVAAAENGRLRAVFDEPQLSVTPGQVAVFYAGDTVLASGMIERALAPAGGGAGFMGAGGGGIC